MPNVTVGKNVPVSQLAYAIGEVETGHIRSMAKRYRDVNSIGATGRYQVMKAYSGPWTKEALGRSYTLAQWLDDPAAQDKVAMYKLGKSQQKYGSWQSAAAVWFSGQPDPNSTRSDGHFTVRQYIDDALRHLQSGRTLDSAPDTSGGGSLGARPAPDTGAVDSLLGALGSVVEPLKSVATAMLSVGKVAEFVMKLALPSTWVRIVCGLFGAVVLLLGLVVLGHEARGT